MRRGIIPHDCYIDGANVDHLRGMGFVFLCLDRGREKRQIIEQLIEWGVPFADVGMGIELVDGRLGGILRVTTGTPGKRDHVRPARIRRRRGRRRLFQQHPDRRPQRAERRSCRDPVEKAFRVLPGLREGAHQHVHHRLQHAGDGTPYEARDRPQPRVRRVRPRPSCRKALYVSIEFTTVVHKCCCGCGREVVTPLSPTDWKLTFDGVSISLHPSIGSWNLPCQSHYWIRHNRVQMGRAMVPGRSRPGERLSRRRRRDTMGVTSRPNRLHPPLLYWPRPNAPASVGGPAEPRPKESTWRKLKKWLFGA